MTLSKSRIFWACVSLHSLMVCFTIVALCYAAYIAPLGEPLLHITILSLFLIYYFYGGVLDIQIFSNDSVMQHRIVSEMKCLSSYRPTPYLINANLQTLFAAIGRPHPDVHFERELVTHVYPDGEVCRLDWSYAPNALSNTPVVIVFHGLTGGSDDSNMHYITQICNRRGWHVVIPVRRGCGDDACITKPKFYAYGGLEDTEYVVEFIATKMAGHPILGVGISAGSNILANYLGLYGKSSKITGAISVANGYCWEKGTRMIQDFHPVWDAVMSNIVHHTLFRRHSIFLDHTDYVTLNPEVHAPNVPIQLMKRVGSQREVDEYVSRRLHGFNSLEDFYRHQSCEYRLENITVPTIFLNALDDPLAHHLNIPVEKLRKNPNTLLITTACGGHLGWSEGLWPFADKPTWMDRFIVEGLESLLTVAEERRHEVALRALRRQSTEDSMSSMDVMNPTTARGNLQTDDIVCTPNAGSAPSRFPMKSPTVSLKSVGNLQKPSSFPDLTNSPNKYSVASRVSWAPATFSL